MSDAIASFYSQPSGQQRGGGKGMGIVMGAGKMAIPLWKNVKEKICEKVPTLADSKLCDRKLTSKTSKEIRSLGERQTEEVGGRIPPPSSRTRVKKRILKSKPKTKKMKKKKLRFADETDDDDDEDPYERKHKRRRRSQISRVLGDDTY